jgi:hypothetical protein
VSIVNYLVECIYVKECGVRDLDWIAEDWIG